MVHGFAVAFAVGAILIGLGAVAGAMLVRAGTGDLQSPALAPAAAEG